MRVADRLVLSCLLLAGCAGGPVPPVGAASATAPAAADPGASGVSGEVGSGNHAASPYVNGGLGSPSAGAPPNAF